MIVVPESENIFGSGDNEWRTGSMGVREASMPETPFFWVHTWEDRTGLGWRDLK